MLSSVMSWLSVNAAHSRRRLNSTFLKSARLPDQKRSSRSSKQIVVLTPKCKNKTIESFCNLRTTGKLLMCFWLKFFKFSGFLVWNLIENWIELSCLFHSVGWGVLEWLFLPLLSFFKKQVGLADWKKSIAELNLLMYFNKPSAKKTIWDRRKALKIWD